MIDTDNLFGTDGIRDRAGEGLLAPESVDRIAVAIAHFARRGRTAPPKVLLGRDPRPSGPDLEERLGRGLAREGCHIDAGGILPTPALSLLVAEEGYDVGIVISASHNPPRFNGIKLFDRWGRKLDVEAEQTLTRHYHEARVRTGSGAAPTPRPDLLERYIELLLAPFPDGFLSGLRVVLDCARGATAPVAPEVFRRAGAEVHAIHLEQDGERINQGCGSLHPEDLVDEVLRRGADLGCAFDGDGDRMIAVDDAGGIVDGDDVLALWASFLHEADQLPGSCVVATVMSNGGFEHYLSEQGITLVRTPVGDREVFTALRREGAVLGGEQSGHIIYSRESATGDGIRTGLHLGRLVREGEIPLSRRRQGIPRYPQTLLAVEVPERIPFSELREVEEAREQAETALAGRGRVFLRYSGTEPVARILVEGEDAAEASRWANRLAESLRADMRIAER